MAKKRDIDEYIGYLIADDEQILGRTPLPAPAASYHRVVIRARDSRYLGAVGESLLKWSYMERRLDPVVIHENAIPRMIDGFRVVRGKRLDKTIFIATGPEGNGWGLTPDEAIQAARRPNPGMANAAFLAAIPRFPS